jgi:CheY-like chemotaxis protein
MSTLRVLVVDDDRSSTTIVSKVLAAHGYAVDVANEGESAVALVMQHPYDLAVVDYQMPRMNGVELFRLAKTAQPNLHGVFLTAYANINTVFPAIEAGFERVMAKPLDSGELIRLVQEMIGPGVGQCDASLGKAEFDPMMNPRRSI